MRSVIRSLAVVGTLVSAAAVLEAQVRPVQRRPMVAAMPAAQQARRGMLARRMMGARVRMIEQRAAAQGRVADRRVIRDRIVAQRAVMRERIQNLSPEQRQLLRTNREAFRVERQRVGEQLRAGAITREQARTQLQTWRREHRLELGLRGPRPGPGGEY